VSEEQFRHRLKTYRGNWGGEWLIDLHGFLVLRSDQCWELQFPTQRNVMPISAPLLVSPFMVSPSGGNGCRVVMRCDLDDQFRGQFDLPDTRPEQFLQEWASFPSGIRSLPPRPWPLVEVKGREPLATLISRLARDVAKVLERCNAQWASPLAGRAQEAATAELWASVYSYLACPARWKPWGRREILNRLDTLTERKPPPQDLSPEDASAALMASYTLSEIDELGYRLMQEQGDAQLVVTLVRARTEILTSGICFLDPNCLRTLDSHQAAGKDRTALMEAQRTAESSGARVSSLLLAVAERDGVFLPPSLREPAGALEDLATWWVQVPDQKEPVTLATLTHESPHLQIDHELADSAARLAKDFESTSEADGSAGRGEVANATYISVYEPAAGPAEQLGTFPSANSARIAVICDKRYISGSQWQDMGVGLVTTMPDGSRFTVAEASKEELTAPKAKLAGESSGLQPTAQSAGPAVGGVVIEVTEQTWASDVVQRAQTTPVITYWWARWCEPCKQLGPVLEELAAGASGQWILAKVDIDANPQLAAELGVQEIPVVAALFGTQVVGALFDAIPEAELRQWLSRVMATAAEKGLRADRESAAPPAGKPGDSPVLPAAQGQPAVPGQPSPRAGTTSLDVLLGQLDGLTGLAPVKAEVRQLIDVVRAEQMRRAAGLPVSQVSRHLVFTGNPGTGKTTVARLLGQLYAAIGVLGTGQLVEVTRSDLVAGYVGQTAIKTTEAVRRALGGILFIDEAYALARSAGLEHDFGQEAVDTLVKLMEDHRDELVVIAAGYGQEMAQFISSNPGLPSRFPRTIRFPDYSTDELLSIFEGMCERDRYQLSPDALDGLRQHLARLPRTPEFGNGRLVRNLFEAALARQASRVVASGGTDLTTLTRQDLSLPDLPGPDHKPGEAPTGPYL